MSYLDRIADFLVASADASRRRFFRHQFLRFVLVGIGNTVFSYSVYALLLFVGLEYRIASLLALVLGIVFSFTTQGALVFRNATRVTFLRFVLAWFLLYLLNISVIALLLRVPMSTYLAGAIATVPVTLASYFILKFAVFGRSKKAPPRPAHQESLS